MKLVTSLFVLAILAIACNAFTIQQIPFDQADIDNILAVHNYERANVFPEAENDLPPLSWDASLANMWAQIRSRDSNVQPNVCTFAHTANADRPGTGENLSIRWASGGITEDTTDYQSGWMGEKAFYNYDDNSCDPGEQCGHYTQAIWGQDPNPGPTSSWANPTLTIGCSMWNCDGDRGWNNARHFICHYQGPGNYGGKKPYTECPTSSCGGSSCTPVTCGANSCGTIGDGECVEECGSCGNTLECVSNTCQPCDSICPVGNQGDTCGNIANPCWTSSNNLETCGCAAGLDCAYTSTNVGTCQPECPSYTCGVGALSSFCGDYTEPSNANCGNDILASCPCPTGESCISNVCVVDTVTCNPTCDAAANRECDSNGNCVCRSGTSDDGNGNCEPCGGACTGFTTCNANSGNCECPYPYTTVPGQGVSSCAECGSSNNCNDRAQSTCSFSGTSEGVCLCNGNLVLDPSSGDCITDPCGDCDSNNNEECVSNSCQCIDGYRYDSSGTVCEVIPQPDPSTSTSVWEEIVDGPNTQWIVETSQLAYSFGSSSGQDYSELYWSGSENYFSSERTTFSATVTTPAGGADGTFGMNVRHNGVANYVGCEVIVSGTDVSISMTYSYGSKTNFDPISFGNAGWVQGGSGNVVEIVTYEISGTSYIEYYINGARFSNSLRFPTQYWPTGGSSITVFSTPSFLLSFSEVYMATASTLYVSGAGCLTDAEWTAYCTSVLGSAGSCTGRADTDNGNCAKKRQGGASTSAFLTFFGTSQMTAAAQQSVFSQAMVTGNPLVSSISSAAPQATTTFPVSNAGITFVEPPADATTTTTTTGGGGGLSTGAIAGIVAAGVVAALIAGLIVAAVIAAIVAVVVVKKKSGGGSATTTTSASSSADPRKPVKSQPDMFDFDDEDKKHKSITARVPEGFNETVGEYADT